MGFVKNVGVQWRMSVYCCCRKLMFDGDLWRMLVFSDVFWRFIMFDDVWRQILIMFGVEKVDFLRCFEC